MCGVVLVLARAFSVNAWTQKKFETKIWTCVFELHAERLYMKVKTLPVVYSYDIGNNRPIFVECRNTSFHAYIICIWVRDHIFFSYMFLVLYILPYTSLEGKYLKRILCRENRSGIVKIAFRGFQGTHQRTV